MQATTMYVLMSHKPTPKQIEDAQTNWKVEKLIEVPCPVWGAIPPEADSVCEALVSAKAFLKERAKRGDLLLVQGDFGATINMIGFARSLGMVPVYATTRRMAVEKAEGDRIVTTRTFEHVRFREYEEHCEGADDGE